MIYMIIAGYFEDDASDELTNDPVFKPVLNKDAYCKTPYLSYGKSANYPYHLLRMIYSFYIYAGTASFGGSHPNAFNFFKYAWIFRSALN